MTVGIYALSFNNYRLVYIGQSVNIEQRTKKHIYLLKNNLHYNKKIIQAYAMYGEPLIDIVEVCTDLSELTTLEDSWIIEFDSLVNGLNMRTAEFTSNNGCSHSQSKFTRDQIIGVFNLLLDDYIPYTEIAKETGTTKGIVSMIACCKVHNWLEIEFPDKYSILRNNIGSRKPAQHSYGIKYPTLIAPNGEEHPNICNLAEFARIHNLIPSSLHRLARGLNNCTYYLGWTVKK